MIRLPVEIHTTDISNFKKCRQLWDFSSNVRRNLELTPTGPNALWFGTGVHGALAEFYAPAYNFRDPLRAIRWWHFYCESEQDFTVDEETEELGHGMLDYYCNTWAPKHDNFEVVHVEQTASFEVGALRRSLGHYPKGTVVVYSYRLDGLLMDVHERFWIKENKTAKNFGGSYDYLLTDEQTGLYLYAEQRRRNVVIEGVYYDVLRKAVPHPPKVLKNGTLSRDSDQLTTYDLYLQALKEKHPDGYPADYYQAFLDFLYTKPEAFVHREIVRRNQHEIRLLWKAKLAEIKDMLDNPAIYKTSSPFTCNGCMFLTPCVVKWEGGNVDNVLAVEYRGRK
jgi:hypothetical protein